MADLAEQIATSGGGAILRTGRVVGITGTALTVDIADGQLVSMPYLDTYLPLLGDYVQVIQQGTVSLVLGAPAGMPEDNVLYNPSFELDLPDTTPVTGWTYWADAGDPGTADDKVDTATGWGPKDGLQWLEINHDTAGYAGSHHVSAAIAVEPGQYWSAAGYVVSSNEAGADEPTLSIHLAFFATSAGAYPGDVLSEATLQEINGPTGPWWVPVRAISGTGTVVPAGAGAMRVVLVSETHGGSVYWDKIVCRRIS